MCGVNRGKMIFNRKYELAYKYGQGRKITLPPAQRERAYGPEGTVNPEPLNGYWYRKAYQIRLT
jgi:hypothetical protein